MKLFITLVAVTCSLFLHAQTGEGEVLEKCHTNKMQDRLYAEHPELQARAEALQAAFEMRMRHIEGSFDKKDGEPYIIPVVFHIVHDFGEENISYAQVQDAVQVMTEDFRALNADVSSVQPEFADLVADVGIEFRLAGRDPQGNCTNGIVRTVSSTTYSGGENLKSVSPIWDRSKYLNIWVCKSIGSGAAGYTYYPSSLAGAFGETNDGIVVRSDYVGGIGSSSSGKRHTLTHEVGHWINLAHVWGSTNDPEMESNCNTDDGVEDTPNTIGWTTCAPHPESCGSLDNIENYMEYAYCSKMFTEGQKTRMLAALTNSVAERSNLWTESNLVETGVFETQLLCDADFTANTQTICAGSTVTYTDQSYSGVAFREWIFEGGFPASSSSIEPTITYSQPGLYSVSLLAFDSAQNLQTEVKTNYIRVLDSAVAEYPYFESFEVVSEGSEFVNAPLYEDGYSDENHWEVTSDAAYTGNKSVRIRDVASDVGSRRNLKSQTFQLTGNAENPVLSFKYACASGTENSEDRLRVYISFNCGDNWNIRKDMGGDELYTTEQVSGELFIPESPDDWNEVVINTIPSLFFTSEFRIRFEYVSGHGNALYIDDINLDEAPVTSVYEPGAEKGLVIYPNPAEDRVIVKFGKSIAASDAALTVWDISGREVLRKNAASLRTGTVELDISGFAPGVYVIRLNDVSGRVVKRP